MNLNHLVKPFTYSLLFICFFLYAIVSYTQQVTWGFNIGSGSVDYGQSAHVDGNGNVYVCGEFRGSNVDFDPSAGTALRNSNGQSDAFVAKYNSNGQYMLSLTIGGGNLDKINAVTTDQAGNIYVAGFFRGANVDFDPSPATAFLTSNGEGGGDPGYGGDIFVAKYSATGQYQWAFNIGGTSLGDNALSIRADAAGNIFVGGYFRESIDFNPSTSVNTLTASTGTAFLARYDTNGQFQWAFNFGAPDIDNVVFDIRLDATNNVYITGYFQGINIDFDPSPATAFLSAAGNFEGYVAKYSSSGQYLFAFKIGGSGIDTGRGLVLDNAGNIYVLGDFNGANVDFDPSPATALVSSNGASDIFVAKYSNTGQYAWAFNAGSGGGEIGWKIGTDNNSIFITGGFSGIADFNPGAGVDNLTTNGGSDIFLAKYSLAGVYQCAFNIGSSGDDNGFDILIAGSDRFYLVGGFRGTNVDFAPSQSTFPLNSNGNDDVFLVKYYWPANTLPAGTIQGNVICGGGTGQLTFTATAGTSPFSIQYTDGTTTYTQNNVISGVPFDLQVTPSITTTYTVSLITDAVRCSPSSPGLMTATVTVDNSLIKSNNDTTVCTGRPVQLNTIGAMSYTWSPATFLSATNIPDPVATPAVSTQYIVTGIAASGCVIKDTVNINVFAVPAISISNDTAICRNTSVQLSVSGGQIYSWSPAGTLSNPASSTPVASPAANTLYYVSITDANNCIHRDSVQVNIRPDAVFTVDAAPGLCLKDSVRLNAAGGDIYDWQPALFLSNNSIPNPWAFPATTTTYAVTITESTCNQSATLFTTVTVLPLPSITATKSNDIDCSTDKSQLSATGGVSYIWSPATYLSAADIADPVASPINTIDYIVQGSDVNGCVNYDTIQVKVDNVNKGGYLMASAFTPNGDGLNDCYGTKLWGIIQEIDFSIYNRWGQLVFHTTNPGACWDGTYKGVNQDTGVFVYMIRAKTNCESTVFRKGTFALIR